MIVTENLLFLSTDKSLYAIDLATHQTVWNYPTHGRLVLSPSLVLYVLQSDFGVPSSRILTFRLG